jgi:hypothetical protein
MSVENILKTLRRADAIDRAEGLVAYLRYNVVMQSIADHYAYPLRPVVAAFCALSPNNDYVGNLRSLVTVVAGHKLGVEPGSIVVSTYGHCKDRALTYLDGVDFLAKTKGPKIRAFYMNIVEPDNPAYVTIDGHMVGVWAGERLTMKEAITTRFKYREIAEGFNLVAECCQILPNQLQAILWFTQKRIHNVVYDPTYNLLDPGDHWRLMRKPEDIKPFPFLTQVKGQAKSELDLSVEPNATLASLWG